MKKQALALGTTLAALGIALGAFGAHAFKQYLAQTGYTDTFETGVRYQMYGAFALLMVGILDKLNGFSEKLLHWAAHCFCWGSIIFACSLYAICATQIKVFGAIAPIGGSLMIAGWICLFLAVRKK